VRVIDRETGKGVEGVDIVLFDGREVKVFSGKSDHEGMVKIPPLKPKTYLLSCKKEDIIPPTKRKVDFQTKQIEIILVEVRSAIEGGLINHLKRPVSQAIVRCFRKDGLQVGGDEWSDDEGRFCFKRIPAGEYKLWIEHPEYFRAETTPFDVKKGRKVVLKAIQLSPIPDVPPPNIQEEQPLIIRVEIYEGSGRILE
jgi:hypothetical protein